MDEQPRSVRSSSFVSLIPTSDLILELVMSPNLQTVFLILSNVILRREGLPLTSALLEGSKRTKPLFFLLSFLLLTPTQLSQLIFIKMFSSIVKSSTNKSLLPAIQASRFSTSSLVMADPTRQSATDKAASAVTPDSEKTMTQKAKDGLDVSAIFGVRDGFSAATCLSNFSHPSIPLYAFSSSTSNFII